MNANDYRTLQLLRAVAISGHIPSAHQLPEDYVKFQKNGNPMLTAKGREAFRELGYNNISNEISKHLRD